MYSISDNEIHFRTYINQLTKNITIYTTVTVIADANNENLPKRVREIYITTNLTIVYQKDRFVFFVAIASKPLGCPITTNNDQIANI